MAAGTINTIVGAGTLNTFPTLLFFGYPPLVANVSNTVGLVAGGITGIHGYRRELAGLGDLLRRLMPVSLVGALTGAILLLWLPESAFDAIVPVLLALSLLLVLLGPRLQPRAEQNEQQRQGEEDRHDGIERRFGEPEQKDGTGQGANKRDRHQPPQEVAQAGQLSAVAMNTRDAACDEANGVGNVGDQRRIPEEQQRRERDQRAGTDDGVDRPRSHSRREQRDDFIPRHPVTLGEDDRAPRGVARQGVVGLCSSSPLTCSSESCSADAWSSRESAAGRPGCIRRWLVVACPSASADAPAAWPRASARALAGSSSCVSSNAVGMTSPVSTHLSAGSSKSLPPSALPIPFRASVSSLGMIHSLLASPRASCGSTWRYWYCLLYTSDAAD